MALFTDGPAPSISELAEEDSGLLDVAESMGVNVTAKLKLAHEELETDLRLWLNKRRPAMELLWAHELQIDQIVVTQPLKRWEAFQALGAVYRDAYFSALADRYQAKWQEYRQLARDARESLVASGLAMVNDPIPRPQPPVLGTTPGPYPGGSYYAAVAGVNRAGQEGAASWASSITTTSGNAILVAPGPWGKNIVAYRIYAGQSLGAMVRQNTVDLPAGLTYTYLPGQVTAGVLPGTGQVTEFVRPLVRTIPRG